MAGEAFVEYLKDATRVPITCSEMQELLVPVNSCLQRIENALGQLSHATPLDADQASVKPDMFPRSYRNGTDLVTSTNKLFQSSTDQSSNRSMMQWPVPKNETQALPMQREDSTRLSESSHNLSVSESSNSAAHPSLAQQKMPTLGEEATPCSNELDDLSSELVSDGSLAIGASRAARTGATIMTSIDCARSKDFIETHKIDMAFKRLNFVNKGTARMSNRVAMSIERWLAWWDSIEEPPGKSWMRRLTASSSFETLCMIAIISNSAFVAYVADWQIQHIGTTEPEILQVVETGFFAFFCVELNLRLMAHRSYFFVNKDMHWNIFDFVLVSISLVDFIFTRIVGAQASGNVGFMRLMRLLKMARIFRSLRSFRFFKSLAVILDSFRRSAVCLFWGLVMLAFVLYLFGLIFMQGLIEHLTFNDVDPITQNAIESKFGSMGTCLLTLYMSVTGGDDWGNSYDIVYQSGSVYGLLFCFFTFFFLFALFNILTGTLVEKAMISAKPDRAESVLNHRKQIIEQQNEFLDICSSMDVDGNGMISWDEFLEWMRNPVMLAYLSSIGLAVDDVELFFSSVVGQRGDEFAFNGEIPIEQFVEGCMRMQGQATAIDVQRVLHSMRQDTVHLQNSLSVGIEQLAQKIPRMWLKYSDGQRLGQLAL